VAVKLIDDYHARASANSVYLATAFIKKSLPILLLSVATLDIRKRYTQFKKYFSFE